MWHSILHSEKYDQGSELIDTRSSKNNLGFSNKKLDCYNGLLLGVSTHQLNKLQIVQNTCCRIIKIQKKYEHISDAMKDLYQQKIPQHIQLKVLVTIYQCVNGLAPPFVTTLLDLNLSRKNLRSKIEGKLPIPRSSLAQVCNNSIRYAGPSLWKELSQ